MTVKTTQAGWFVILGIPFSHFSDVSYQLHSLDKINVIVIIVAVFVVVVILISSHDSNESRVE